MDADCTSGTALREIEVVWVVDVQGLVGAALRIVRIDLVYAFGHEHISFLGLSASERGELADCPLSLFGAVFPDFELEFLLVDYDHRLGRGGR